MRTSTGRAGARPHAFTLVELLIILTVLTILASLLFPVFAEARQERRASCLSNRQQFARAFDLYAQDYDQTSVPFAWQQGHWPYLPASGPATCPNLVMAGPPSFIHIRGYAHGGQARPKNSPDMTWHGGQIMVSATTEAIYWGTSWGNTSFVGDKISGLKAWYMGFGGSNYAKTSTEYTGTNGQVTGNTTFSGDVIDTSPAPSNAPSTSTILSEVCKVITNPVSNGYYAVYVDTRRGGANYCAWHSYGSCNGVPVQIAFFFNLDGDPGCDPQDTQTGHSQGLAALANVSGHELSEAHTDPRDGGWYDRQGAENGDKCAWTFNVPYVTFTNGTKWKIQGEWSNHAYDTGTGYPNLNGQKGCLDGH